MKTRGAPIKHRGFSALPTCDPDHAVSVAKLPRRPVPQSRPVELAPASVDYSRFHVSAFEVWVQVELTLFFSFTHGDSVLHDALPV